MELSELPPAIQKIANLGPILWDKEEWADYRALGIGPENIPKLIEIIEHAPEFWEDSEAEDEPIEYLPVHAWRALGQMQAEEAIPALLDLLRMIGEEGEEDESDLIQGELPDVFGTIGPAAVPHLSAYLLTTENELWARITAADSLKKIAQLHPPTRDEVVDTLMRALRREMEENPSPYSLFTGLIILFLGDLKAVVAAPLVEQAYNAGLVDDTIGGDWEDFQMRVGLLDKRLTAPRIRPAESLVYSEDVPQLDELQQRARAGREDQKTKKMRKQAKASRQKNRPKSHLKSRKKNSKKKKK